MSQRDQLPYYATVDVYDQEARKLQHALNRGEEDAAWRYKWVHPRFRGQSIADVRAAPLDLDDARQVIASEYAFHHWSDLAAFATQVHDNKEVERFEAAVEAVIAGDENGLRKLLAEHPELVRARSTRGHRATLLHYLGANGVEGARQKTPANAMTIMRILLDGGAEVDALANLYDQSCTTMSMLVSSCHPANAGLQIALAETLLDHGAALDGRGSAWQSAVLTALKFGYPDTAKALAKRAGRVDELLAAAGLGQVADARRLLEHADEATKHGAFALAAQHGQTEIVRLLLDGGADPNRYNPEGFHSHSAPLHQAVAAGHLEVVRLLLDRGARLDLRDKIHDGTPLGWAEHCNQPAIATYLREQSGMRG